MSELSDPLDPLPNPAAQISEGRTPGSLDAHPAPAAEELLDPEVRRAWGWAGKAGFASLVAIVVLLGLTGRLEALAQDLLASFGAPPATAPAESAIEKEAPAPAAPTVRFRDMPQHPDNLYKPYFAGELIGDASADPRLQLIAPFRQYMSLYEQRQGQDDNFSIRVVDDRSGETLELFTLEGQKTLFKRNGHADWNAIDRLRRTETSRLVQKWADKGVPRADVTVKWGRANQVREARERELPYILYEVRLARYLGLSLLATEIGTVETFNDDKLVSSVGARSRYQMMPYILRQRGINQYTLPTGGGQRVQVVEEWHPLLTMEPAFMTLRGYANAVGHEVPGISSYHTGPGNIYNVYRMYLTEGQHFYSPDASVMDAYMWALTEGYPTISSKTSFKTYSRGYVASAYGALLATDTLPIDTTMTYRGDRVQLAEGQEIFLSQLLHMLRGADLDWGAAEGDSLSDYQRFRRLNPHMALPAADEKNVVPVSGDVRLTATSGGSAVRFFLPLGATRVLTRQKPDLLDPRATFRYDGHTFERSARDETLWDREYADLIEASANFGFTFENRARLERLADQFERMAQENPTFYRLAQLDAIRTHRTMWRTGVWEKLAETAEAVKGTTPAPVLPPENPTTSAGR